MKQISLFFIMALTMASCQQLDDENQYKIGTWQGFRNSAVTLTFDDGCSNQFDIAVPLLDQFDYKATFYPVASWVKDWAPLCKIAANGHEVSSHTYTHPYLSKISTEKVEKEFQQAIDTIKAYVPMAICNTIAYPYCDQPNLDLVSKYYIAARICDNQIVDATPQNYMTISSFCVGSETKYIEAVDLIGLFCQALEKKGWCVLLFHEIDNGTGYSPFASSEFEKTLEYLADNDTCYWVSTFSNVAKYTKERDAARLRVLSADEDKFEIKIETGLDANIYNVPLTVSRTIPDGWDKIDVIQNNHDCNAYTIDKTLYFDAIPNGEPITIKKR